MLYFSFRSLLRFLYTIFFRYRVIGAENIPKTGPAIICSNHISNLDPPLVGCAATRIVHFMAKEELFRIPLFRKLLDHLNAFPVNRTGGGRRALKKSLELLKEDKILGIFPEGTRSKTGKLGKGHIGAALLASKVGAPLIPTAIIGPYRLFRPIHIVFGKPIDLREFDSESSNSVQDITDHLMKEIQDLLDGYNKDHYK